MRIVVDSNVWISALVFGGTPRVLLQRSVVDGYTLILSQEIITEIHRVLHEKFPDFVSDFDDLLVALSPRTSYVALGSDRVTVCRDPDDNMVLETALAGNATHIISGDKDLLSLASFEGIQIVEPSKLL